MCAILAAVFYALNSPLSKLLLNKIGPTMMAAFLYLGTGLGMAIYQLAASDRGVLNGEQKLTRKELPYTIGMVLLDIAAPIALMIGITRTSAANVALLNNFEIVATSMIALVLFREKISAKLWLGIGLVTVSGVILTVEDMSGFSFSAGSVFVLIACLCWGFENNWIEHCVLYLCPERTGRGAYQRILRNRTICRCGTFAADFQEQTDRQLHNSAVSYDSRYMDRNGCRQYIIQKDRLRAVFFVPQC